MFSRLCSPTTTTTTTHRFFSPHVHWASRWYQAKNDANAARRRAQDILRRRPPPFSAGGRGGGGGNPLLRWLHRVPHNAIVYGILGVNGAVYVAWVLAQSKWQEGDPTWMIALSKNLLMSWQNIQQGRVWTILTCCFSHSSASHIFFNAFTFFFMAPPVIRALGNVSFLTLYLGGGIVSSLVSLAMNKSVRDRHGASNGASGAIYAVVSFFACAAPFTTFYFFGVVPVPAWILVSGLFVWDGLSTLTDRKTQVDGAGHVGGMVAGAAYYFLRARGIRGL